MEEKEAFAAVEIVEQEVTAVFETVVVVSQEVLMEEERNDFIVKLPEELDVNLLAFNARCCRPAVL